MEQFSQFVIHVDNMVWSMVLVLLCLGVGLYLSLRMRFPQIRLLREMVRLLTDREKCKSDGITTFQSFATTVGARVGMGNIAGVASAIFYGGPGSVFWMWIIALISAVSAYAESALAQAYKVRNADGTYQGGPAYYIEKGLKCKPYASLFAVVAFLGPGLLMPGVQINSLVTVFEEAFSVSRIVVGLICCLILGIVVYGSIKRIAKLAELLAPLMCGIYIVAALFILFTNITRLPGVLTMIFQSAFGVHAVFGGILGSAVSWGEALSILCDMFFDSAFAEADVESERGVILEEIGMYADDPSDLVSEKLSAAVFHGTPLGRPILGRKATLDKMTGAWLKEYKQSHYTADRIIITLAGSFTDEILDEIRARFSVMTPGKAKKLKRVTAQDSIVVKKKATEQNHLLAAFPAITDRDPRKYQMQLLSSILGGGMSSRLFSLPFCPPPQVHILCVRWAIWCF